MNFSITPTEVQSLESVSTVQKNTSKEYELLIYLQKALGQKKEAEEIYGVIDNYINNNSNGDNSNVYNSNSDNYNDDNFSVPSKKVSGEVAEVKGLIISQKAIDKHLLHVKNPEERKMLEDLKSQVEEKLAESIKNLNVKEDSKKIEELLKKELEIEVARSSLKIHNERMAQR